jgi:hypothetical protein
VDGGHPAALQTEAVVQNLHHGREAVGGAGGVRDDVVRRRVVRFVVHAHHQSDVRLLGGRRDDHLLGSRRQMFGGTVAVGEFARALEHHVHAQVAPRQRGGVFGGEHLELVAVHDDAVGLALNRGGEVAEDRVVLQQMGQRRGIREVVDRHKIDAALGERCAHDVAPDAPEPIDANSHGHALPPVRAVPTLTDTPVNV